MKYRQLGRTGLRVSVVGVGTWQFGGEWGKPFSQAEANAILGRAHDLGINLVDTAECYGDHVSERLVGEAIKGQRDSWIVATKFGHSFAGHLMREQRWSPDQVLEQLEDSLRALQTGVIDLYQFHSGTDEVFDNDDLWTALDKQVQGGKVRYLGISISSGIDAGHQAARATAVGASVLQVVYNRLDRRPEEQVFPHSLQQDLGVLARVPLASGFLSDKYRPGDTFTNPQDVRAAWDEADVQRQLEEAAAIREAEVPAGVPTATWALAWCLQHQAVTSVIPGCKSPEQVEANAAAAQADFLVRADHPQAMA